MLARLSTKWVAPAFAVLLTLGLVFAANSFRTHSASAHPINAAAPAPTTPATITLSTSAWSLTFNELSSITSTVKQIEYTSGTGHTKQIGTAQPPTVVLKRILAPAANQTLSTWHQMARSGDPTAQMDATLTINQTGGKITYALEGAWLSKLVVSNVTAGSKQPAVETATIVCDEMAVH